MTQKIISTQWDRENRNAQNSNFDHLFQALNNVTGKITDEIYDEIRNDVKLNWKEPVDTVDDLPSSAETGDTRMIREGGLVYRYSGSAWVEIQEINATAITEVEQRLQTEIDAKETPEGAQAKANAAEASAIEAVQSLETKIYSDVDEVVKVVESGSNANGQYIRYSDGMQYCWGEPFNQIADVAIGSLWRSETQTWTYPKPFIARPVVSAQAMSYARWADIAGSPGLTSVPICQYGFLQGSTAYATSVLAVGRWK